MKKTLGIALLLGLGFFLKATPSAQQAGRVLYVNNQDPACGGHSPCFTTIQAAVDVAQARDTIQIHAGRYPEQVTIQKNDSIGASETDRIVIEADPELQPDSVVVTGSPGPQCTDKFAIRIKQSKYITIRGLTITGTGAQAIFLLGGNNGNQAIHIERNRLFGNGSSSCNGGITIARGNPGTLIANNLIYANGRNGIAFIDADGGPHYIVNNTIYGNQWNGIDVTRGHETFVLNNIINQNGTLSGSTGGRFGVQRENSTNPQPQGIHLLNNLICGNRLGEINGPALDATDSGNLTPQGNEGSGVSGSPNCQVPGSIFANVNGPDGLPSTADDTFQLISGSSAIDIGSDPRVLGLNVSFNTSFEADYSSDSIRPRLGIRGGAERFDMGAFEYILPNQPPVANAGQPLTVASGAAFNLNGAGSFDPDGDVISYQWSQSAGPTITLSNATSATPTAIAPSVTATTLLVFQLMVSDGVANGTASVNVTVLKPNQPPLLDPIGNKIVNVGNTLTFAANGSDPDGDPLTFAVSPQPLPANASFDAASRVFTFTPTASQVGSFNVTFAATDGRGGTASETISITVTNGVSINITSPMNGATVPGGLVIVRGTITSTNIATFMSVNGFPALVNGNEWAGQVSLAPGTQTISAIATAIDGAQTSQTITVNASSVTSAGLVLSGAPSSGVAPLTVTWQVGNQTGRTLVQFEFDQTGAGIFGAPTAKFDGTQSTYTTPGLFFPMLRATDDQGVSYVTTAVVEVGNGPAIVALFQNLWTSFKARLEAGDIQGALAHLSPVLRPRFEALFQQIGSNLSNVAASFGDLEVLEQIDEIAETAIIQQENNVPKLYFIYFRRDPLGRWLIEEM